jgi:hypothetical protein
MASMIAVLAFTAGFSQDFGDKGGFGPGNGHPFMQRARENGFGGMQARGGFRPGAAMGRLAPIIGYLGLESNFELLGISIERVRLDAREKNVDLKAKMKVLMEKFGPLCEKAATDKTAASDLVQVMKDINALRVQEQEIRKDTMSRIQALQEKNEKDINAAADAFLQKIGSDSAELDKFLHFLAKQHRPEFQGHREWNGDHKDWQKDASKDNH